MTFAEKVISFLKDLEFDGMIPEGIRIMNPFREDPRAMIVAEKFYKKFYSDNNPRHLILGINPGRFGAGSTGVPFTDTIRLKDKCGIEMEGLKTLEPSSAFIYEMIDAYGGPAEFYSDFYISAVSPLGFTAPGKTGKQVNYNYYDNRELESALSGFITENVEKQLGFGIIRDLVFCLGTGKNFRFIKDLNDRQRYFGGVIPLEHPRFIMQYRLKQKKSYISKYISEFSKATGK
jgi:hypothetical protein